MFDFERMRRLIRELPKSLIEQDTLEADLIEKAELEEAYAEAIKELRDMRKQLRPMIDKLGSPKERAAMRLRYLHGYSIDQIANDANSGYSRSAVHRYLESAEKKINR